MSLRALMFVVLSLSVSACVSDPYKISDDQIGNAASIQGYSQRDGLTTWLYVHIMTIDGRQVDYGVFSDIEREFPITPGNHRVVVELEANSGFGGVCPCKRTEIFNLLTEPKHAYRAKAQLEGNNAKLWIEDLATNEPVTQVINLRPRGF